MIIANPLYDVVFKCLLKDMNMARELLSTILDEEIERIELKPQETATETGGRIPYSSFRFQSVHQKAEWGIAKRADRTAKGKTGF